jgi:hypothetical protein
MPRRFTFVALAGVVAMGSLVVAVQTGAGAVAKAKVRPAAVTGLDHFLCYDVSPVPGTVPITPPTGVTLANQFSPSPFKPKFSPVDLHCNPALKVVPSGQFKPVSPSWHLMCFSIAGTKQKPNQHIVQVANQFGTAKLQTAGPDQFCLPSLKSLASPPVFNPPGPGEIMPDHFTCYPVRAQGTSHFKLPTKLKVQDQFGGLVPATVTAPTELCVPTQKTVKGAIKGPITNPAAHLLCFPVTKTPVKSPIADQNQFGTGLLNVANTATLCLPSDKRLIR